MNNEGIKFKNVTKGLCIVCDKPIDEDMQGYWICEKCHKPCKPVVSDIVEKEKTHMVVDAKSDCCNEDVINDCVRITCCSKCHVEFIDLMEKSVGVMKKVVDGTTNIAYKVPTREIIENGLKWEDLPKYPKWE